MINTDKLCPMCMNNNEGEQLCPVCGFNQNEQNSAETLPLKYLLSDRFFIGKALSRNSEGITYIAYDTKEETVVEISEYFPSGVSRRNPDKTVSIVSGNEFSYNEGLMEFLEINRTLIDAQLPSVPAVYSAFEENGTSYSVHEKINGITLSDFLERNGKTLKWEQARPLFLPLIDTVIALNEKRIFHLGISPETVIVGRDAKLRLSGICVKSTRCLDNDIKPQIFDGYAAAEQYGIVNLNVGSHTDVYGLSATLFRTLIGMVPPKAIERMENDGMTIPSKFADELPRQVLVALANGLQVLPENRTSSVEAFRNELVYGETQENVRRAAQARKAAKEAELAKEISSDSKTAAKVRKTVEKQVKPVSGTKYAVISAGCTAGFFILVGIICLIIFRDSIFSSPSDKKSQSSSMPSVPSIGEVDKGANDKPTKLYGVPDFVGKYFSQVDGDDEYEYFKFKISSKQYSDNVARGAICSQSVKAGSDVAKGTVIEFVISLGPKEIKIANVIGQTKETAVIELLKQGFIYENITVEEKYDSTKKPNVIIQQTPKYGSLVNTEIGITIYINSYTGDEE